MNWYELAGPDEVKEVLEGLLKTYNFAQLSYERPDGKYGVEEPVYINKIFRNGYEIAEALWGEYGEEVL